MYYGTWHDNQNHASFGHTSNQNHVLVGRSETCVWMATWGLHNFDGEIRSFCFGSSLPADLLLIPHLCDCVSQELRGIVQPALIWWVEGIVQSRSDLVSLWSGSTRWASAEAAFRYFHWKKLYRVKFKVRLFSCGILWHSHRMCSWNWTWSLRYSKWLFHGNWLWRGNFKFQGEFWTFS